jgi:hypothetical protein
VVSSATSTAISDLGNGGNDVLTIGTTAAGVTATVTADYTASSASSNSGTANATLTGSGSTDVINVASVTGNTGFTLIGNTTAANTDALTGSKRPDTLIGNGGIDALTGGTGADVFVFTGNTAVDDIVDFSGSTGDGDKVAIDLSEIVKTAAAATGLGFVATGATNVLTNGISAAVTTSSTPLLLDVDTTEAIDSTTAITAANVINLTSTTGYASATAANEALFGASGIIGGSSLLQQGDNVLVQYKLTSGDFVLAVMGTDVTLDSTAVETADITTTNIVTVGTTALTASDITFI